MVFPRPSAKWYWFIALGESCKTMLSLSLIYLFIYVSIHLLIYLFVYFLSYLYMYLFTFLGYVHDQSSRFTTIGKSIIFFRLFCALKLQKVRGAPASSNIRLPNPNDPCITYIYPQNGLLGGNVGKYVIHGAHGKG